MLRLPLIACLAFLFCARAQKKDPLEEAEQLLRTNSEPRVRQGAQLCRSLNTKRSIELLLKLLDGTQPHMRDIAWEELPQFTDGEARRRVDQELRTSSNPDMQAWCLELLGCFGDATHGKTVESFASSKNKDVQRAAVRSLGLMRYAPASKRLAELTASKDPIVRANAHEALARISADANQVRALQALADADGGVRAATLGWLPELYPDLAEPRSIAMLTDADWRVAKQATDNLATELWRRWEPLWLAGLRDPSPIVATPEASGAIIDALITATRNVRPIVAQHAQAVLRRFTGMAWTEAQQWEGWWQARRRQTTPPPSSRPGETRALTRAAFFGLYVLSDHVAFLIDKSNDMNQTLKSEPRSKADAALDELEATLAQLPDGIQCELYTYATEVTPFQKKPVRLDARERKAMVNFVRAEPNTGQKDIWNALCLVLGNPTVDTIYLLSSGEPEVGRYVHYNRITEHLRDLNRFHKVVIHTVSYTSSDWYREQIVKIAQATGGEHTVKD